jgi:two-component system response regulator YesN
VLLSGYREFEMAQEAIGYNVSHYLLKPTDLDEVSRTFRKIRGQLEREENEREKALFEKQQLKDMVSVMQEQFLGSLMRGVPYTKDDILEQIGLLGFGIRDEHPCSAFTVDIMNLQPGQEDRLKAVRSILSGTKELVHFFPIAKPGQTLHLLAVAKELEVDWRQVIERHLQAAQNSLKTIFGLEIRFNSLGDYPNLFSLAEYIQAASQPGERSAAESVAMSMPKDAVRAIIKRAKEYIQKNCGSELTLVKAADQAYLNPVYFSRLFKQETGENFSDFLISVRIEKAMELLREPRYKVYEIGLLCGYRNTKYFYKIFKKTTGVTPNEYRERALAE